MMRKTKTGRTVELTIERSEFFVVPSGSARMLAWCDGCGGRVPFVTPGEAALVSGENVRAIFRRVEAMEIHFVETPGGRLLVCLESVVRG